MMTWTLPNSLPGLVKSLKSERIDLCTVFHALGVPVDDAQRTEQALATGYSLSGHLLAEQWHMRV